MSKEPIIAQLCECGDVINDDTKSSDYVSFSRPDLDGFHGIWNGARGEYITFDPDKKWCSMECFIKSINNYEYKQND